MILYSIYDLKANEFGPVFEAKNNEVAIRKCKLEFAKAPVEVLADYVLYEVGSFSSDDGVVAGNQALICNLSTLFESPKEEVN